MSKFWSEGYEHPITIGLQQLLFLGVDGFWGEKTTDALKKYQIQRGATGPNIDGVIGPDTMVWLVEDGLSLAARILELIAYFEGAGQDKNAWANTSEIDDGAGKNYGVMQINKFGSMQTVVKRYMPAGEDFSSWIGTSGGAIAQMKYFLEMIWSKAWDMAAKLGDGNVRTVAVICDAIVQGGDCWPSSAPKSWDDWQLDPAYIPQIQSLYNKYSVKEAFWRSLRLSNEPGVMFAELHPRSGTLRWQSDQLSRRRTIVQGSGVVHGDKYNLTDFGL